MVGSPSLLAESNSAETSLSRSFKLNASYAADGYARVKGTLGVLVTVFGVGELSGFQCMLLHLHLQSHSTFFVSLGAANGIAGSYAESIPVLHVVGVPSTALQAKGLKLHHTLGDGRFQVFQDVYSKITCSQSHIASSLRDGNVTEAIDKVIFEALKYNKPTYLTLPTDLLDGKSLYGGLPEGGCSKCGCLPRQF